MEQPVKTSIPRGALLGAATNSAFRWSPIGEVTESLSLGSRNVDEFYPEPRDNLGLSQETVDCVGSPQSRSPSGRNIFTTNGCSKQEKVKVYVRMRPFSESEKVCPLRQVLCLIGETIVVRDLDQKLTGNSKEPPHKGEAIEFKVDYMQDDSYLRVHSEIHKEESQKRMYGALGVPCIESALDGFNTTILAYGQTGSGKTYTMMGDGTEAGRGLIPRLAFDLMKKIKEECSNGVLYTVQVSYLEIYQEKIRDLLAAEDELEEDTKQPPQPPHSLEPGDLGGTNVGEKVRLSVSIPEEKVTRPYTGSLAENSYTNSFLNKAAIQRQLEASQKQGRILPEEGKSPFEKLVNTLPHDGISRGKSPKRKPAFDTVFNRQKVHKHYRTFPVAVEEAVPVRKQNFLKIREHPITGPFVEGLLWKDVCNWYDMENLMKQGSTSRTTAATDMNEQSSRSHAVFSIRLTRKLGPDLFGMQPSSLSYINLVDLAGSEKLPKLCSGAVPGQRTQEESRCINRSLSQLNEVILSLSRSSFVSYRNSVLTWLLKESLGGNSRTFMVANISPTEKDLRESVNTLRYATTASRIPPAAALDQDPRNKLIKKLKEEICTLRTLLSSFTSVKPTSGQLPSLQGFKVPCLDVGLQVEYNCSDDSTCMKIGLHELIEAASQTENHVADVEQQPNSRCCASVEAGFQIMLKDCRSLDMGNQTTPSDCGAVDIGHQTFIMDFCTCDFGHQTFPQDFGLMDVGRVTLTVVEAVMVSDQIKPKDGESYLQVKLQDFKGDDVDDQISLAESATVDVVNHIAPRESEVQPSQDHEDDDADYQGGFQERWGDNTEDQALMPVDRSYQIHQTGFGTSEVDREAMLQKGRALDIGYQVRWVDFGASDIGNQIDWRDFGCLDFGHQVFEGDFSALGSDLHISLKDCGAVDIGVQVGKTSNLFVSEQQVSWTGSSAIGISGQVTREGIQPSHLILYKDCGAIDVGLQANWRELELFDLGQQISWRRSCAVEEDTGTLGRVFCNSFKDCGARDCRFQVDSSFDFRQLVSSTCTTSISDQVTQGDTAAYKNALDTNSKYSGAFDVGLQADWRRSDLCDRGKQTSWTDFGTIERGNQVIVRTCSSDYVQQIPLRDCQIADVCRCEAFAHRCPVTLPESVAIDVGEQLMTLKGQEFLHHSGAHHLPAILMGSQIVKIECQEELENHGTVDVDQQSVLRGWKALDISGQQNWRGGKPKERGNQVDWKDLGAIQRGHQTTLVNSVAVSVGQQTTLDGFMTVDIGLQTSLTFLRSKRGDLGLETASEDSGAKDVEQQSNLVNLGAADVRLQTIWTKCGPRGAENQVDWRNHESVEFGCQASFDKCIAVPVDYHSTPRDLSALSVASHTRFHVNRPLQAWKHFQCGVCGSTPANSMMVVSTMVPIHEKAAAEIRLQTTLDSHASANELQKSSTGWESSSLIDPKNLKVIRAVNERGELNSETLHPHHCRESLAANEWSCHSALKACKSVVHLEEWSTSGDLLDVKQDNHGDEVATGRAGYQISEQDYVVPEWQYQARQEVGRDHLAHQWQHSHGCQEIMLTEPSYLVTGSDVDSTNWKEETSWNGCWGIDRNSQVLWNDLRKTGFAEDIVLGQVQARNVEHLQSRKFRSVEIGVQTSPRISARVDFERHTDCWMSEGYLGQHTMVGGIESGSSTTYQIQFRMGKSNTTVFSQTESTHEMKLGTCDFSHQVSSKIFRSSLQTEEMDNSRDLSESRGPLDMRLRHDKEAAPLACQSGFVIYENEPPNVSAEDAFHLCCLWILAKSRSRTGWCSIQPGRSYPKFRFPMAKCRGLVLQSRCSPKVEIGCQKDGDSTDHRTDLMELVLHLCSFLVVNKLQVTTAHKESKAKHHRVKKFPILAAPGKIMILDCRSDTVVHESHSSPKEQYHPPGLKQLQYAGVEPVTFKSNTPFFIQTSGDCSLVKTRHDRSPRSGNTGGLSYKIVCGIQSQRVVHFLKDGVNRLGSNKGAHLYVKGLSENHTEFVYMPPHRCVHKMGYVVARLVAPGAMAFLNGIPMLENRELGTGDVLVLKDLSHRSSVCRLHFFDLVKIS